MITPPKIEEFKTFISLKKRDKTNYIVVHCAATQPKPEYDRRTIDQFHRSQFLCIGYHFVIKTDGTIQEGRPLDTVGAHVKGYNNESVGICLIGGIDKKGNSCNNFTDEQFKALRELIVYLLSVYPDAKVQGHRDFPNVAKDCPCFDVKEWFGKYPKYVRYDGTIPKYEMSETDFYKINGKPPYELNEVLRVG